MKILYVLNSGKPGGMEHHVRLLIKGMVQKGHSVFVWCPEGVIGSWYRELGAAVTFEIISSDIDIRYIRKLVHFIKNNNIDVVHSHELKAVINSLIAARIAKACVSISHTHTPISEWQISNPVKKLLVLLESRLYALAVNMFSDCEIALTESRKAVKMSEGIFKNKLFIIPNCLEESFYSISEEQKAVFRGEIRHTYNIPDDALLIGNVGRHTREKGQEVLVKAFAKTSGSYLMLAGGGLLEEHLKSLATQLGVSDKLVITGVFNQQDIQKYYCAIDLFVFPSLAEGFGLVLIEAMSMGIPVIASDLEVLKEVGGDTISYFKCGDYKDLAEKIEYSLTHSSNEKVANAKQRVVKLYSEASFVNSYNDLYNSLRGKKALC